MNNYLGQVIVKIPKEIVDAYHNLMMQGKIDNLDFIKELEILENHANIDKHEILVNSFLGISYFGAYPTSVTSFDKKFYLSLEEKDGYIYQTMKVFESLDCHL